MRTDDELFANAWPVSSADASRNLSSLLRRLEERPDRPYAITRQGQVLAVLISVSSYARLASANELEGTES